ncbi:MAG: DNA-protecting protein DprA [Leptolyngbya sp. SIO4C1]|nr:DNA-protecting protein DprA [Leptolyngbya sp. SIO4C1]
MDTISNLVTSERAYWVAWSRLERLGPILLKRLCETFGSLADAWQAPAAALQQVDGIGDRLAASIVRQRRQLSPTALLAQLEAANQSFWTPADADYPHLLFETVDPPPVLYYRGPLRLNNLPSTALTVGMVGTRRPSNYGSRWTQRLGKCLSQQGYVIVSGLADGIDTLAHRSCLKQQGLTVAVLGTGVDVVYPRFNQLLYDRICQTGLILSEYPDGTPPSRAHFPQRNRIIAGLSRALLVTEAPQRSGALITAHLANDYGREVYALPSSVENPCGRGCLELIAQGCQMILDETTLCAALSELPAMAQAADVKPSAREAAGEEAAEVEAAVDSSASQAKAQATAPHPAAPDLSALTPELSAVFAAISTEPASLEAIADRTQLETGTILSSLVQLELLGLVMQLPGMRYQRAIP